MSNTKFIKVFITERLPKKGGSINSNLGVIFYNDRSKKFEDNDLPNIVYPYYFLEEVPDRESELIEMLEKCKESLDWVYENCIAPDAEMDDEIHHILFRKQELEYLIQSVKQPK